MAECRVCKAFTKYEGGLCLVCYNEKKNGTNGTKETSVVESNDEKSGGLDASQRNYRYSMIKGRIAETLIQELFLSLGYNVFR